MGNEEEKETAMMMLQHQDCDECRLNIEIIGINGDLISKQILQGMEKSGEQVAVHVRETCEIVVQVAGPYILGRVEHLALRALAPAG